MYLITIFSSIVVICCFRYNMQSSAILDSLSDSIICCCIKLGSPFLCAISKLDSLYLTGFIVGEVINERLTISGHTDQLDSSFALQNIHAGHPLTTTLFASNPLSVLSTNGNSISSESCERMGFNKFQSSCSGGSKNTRILPFNSISVRHLSYNTAN